MHLARCHIATGHRSRKRWKWPATPHQCCEAPQGPRAANTEVPAHNMAAWDQYVSTTPRTGDAHPYQKVLVSLTLVAMEGRCKTPECENAVERDIGQCHRQSQRARPSEHTPKPVLLELSRGTLRTAYARDGPEERWSDGDVLSPQLVNCGALFVCLRSCMLLQRHQQRCPS